MKAPRHFRCVHCRLDIPTDAPGTQHRNHCPSCLWSRHVDARPGDRAMADECGSSMEPIAISVRGKGEWVVIHRCTGCGELKSNRAAGDDSPLLLGFSAAYSSFLRRLQDAGVDPEGIFAALEEMKVGLIDTATLMEAETGGVDP